MTATPGVDYPVLTTYQPDEPPLQLPLSILRDVRAALDEIGEEPQRRAFGSFILCPWTSERAQMQKRVWCHCGSQVLDMGKPDPCRSTTLGHVATDTWCSLVEWQRHQADDQHRPDAHCPG